MNRMKQVSRPVLCVVGLALVLAAGSLTASETPNRGRCERAADDLAANKDRYYVYGQTGTRVGERWVLLGVYGSADEAANVAKANKVGPDGRGYYDCQVTSGANLQLPPAEEKTIFWVNRLTHDGKTDYDSQARYATLAEAAAAADKILAGGDKFSVTYDLWSQR